MYNKRFIADKQRSIKELYGHSVCWRRYGSTGSGTMSSNLQGYKTRYALGCTCLADYKLMATECYMREFCIRHGIVKLSILLYTEGYRGIDRTAVDRTRLTGTSGKTVRSVKYAKNIATRVKEIYEEEDKDSVHDQDLSKGGTSNASVIWAIHRCYTMNRHGGTMENTTSAG